MQDLLLIDHKAFFWTENLGQLFPKKLAKIIVLRISLWNISDKTDTSSIEFLSQV